MIKHVDLCTAKLINVRIPSDTMTSALYHFRDDIVFLAEVRSTTQDRVWAAAVAITALEGEVEKPTAE